MNALTDAPPQADTSESLALPLDKLSDLTVNVSVELGRKRMKIKELLALTPGSVIELDREAGEPLDIYASDVLVARGEVVVINDNKYGIRVTDVLRRSA
jgi:flagellar motor switch protein FliN